MADRTATGRLRRLLALVPYVLAHQGQPLRDVAAHFDLSERELVDDLNLLWVCGLPGYSHLELIDVSYDSGDLYIRNAEVISAPMRLHRDEAMALVVGLQLLEQLATSDDRAAVADLRAKILAAAINIDAADSHRVAVVAPADSGVGATIAEALGRHRRLLLQYFVPARDEVTSREVDPIAITTIDGQRYLRAWCRSAEGLRHFRLDRIESAKIIDRPAAAPAMDLASEPDFLSGEFTARLRLGPDALWLIDHLGATVVTEEEGSRIVEVAYSDARLILAIGRQVGSSMEILEPRELRDRARHQAEAALANYALK